MESMMKYKYALCCYKYGTMNLVLNRWQCVSAAKSITQVWSWAPSCKWCKNHWCNNVSTWLSLEYTILQHKNFPSITFNLEFQCHGLPDSSLWDTHATLALLVRLGKPIILGMAVCISLGEGSWRGNFLLNLWALHISGVARGKMAHWLTWQRNWEISSNNFWIYFPSQDKSADTPFKL